MVSERFKKLLWDRMLLQMRKEKEDVNLGPLKEGIVKATTLSEVVAALEGTILDQAKVIFYVSKAQELVEMYEFMRKLDKEYNGPDDSPFTVHTRTPSE